MPTRGEGGLPSEVRLVVVIPGIGGSVLRNGRGEDVWNARISSIPGSLLRLGELAADQPLTPAGLIGSTTLFGYSVLHGYHRFVQGIADLTGWAVDWGVPGRSNPTAQVLAFPYDFRQCVEGSANRLGEVVSARLADLRLTGQPNRVLVIAHSMGGLVARRWVANGNWECCRAVVTLGTPHRGAPKALQFLVNGAPWWTGRAKGIGELLRGWPAMYALLPRYPMIVDLRPGADAAESAHAESRHPAEDLYPHELPMDWLREPAAKAYRMHLEIERQWRAHQSETDCVVLRGVGNATLLHSRWDGRRLITVKEQLPAHLERSRDLGDGTVPAIAATPREQAVRLSPATQLPVRHSRLVTSRTVLREIEELLRWAEPDNTDVGGRGLMIGLAVEDAYLEGEPVVIEAFFHPAEAREDDLGLACRIFRDEQEQPIPPMERDPDASWRYTVTLAGLVAGRYRIEVRAVSQEPRPMPAQAVEEFFVVPAVAEEPAGDAPSPLGARIAGDSMGRDEAYRGLRFEQVPSSAEPLDDDALRRACYEIRQGQLSVTAEIVERTVATQQQLRRMWDTTAAAAPAAAQQESLWLLGWLFYESSWALTRQVRASFDPASGQDPNDPAVDDRIRTSAAAYALIIRLSVSYLQLPWPQWAPRGLGVLRARALAESKRDTEVGYSEAWLWHDEAKDRYQRYRRTTPTRPPRLRLGLAETMLQLALAETGTACRGVERTLGLWGEPPSGTGPVTFDGLDAAETQRGMYDRLTQGSQFGREALEQAGQIDERYGLVYEVDEERMALVTAFQNPGIMTARACLLMLPLCAGMEQLGRPVDPAYGDWAEVHQYFLETFHQAYRAIEAEVIDQGGHPRPFNKDFQRPLVHIRLHYGLLMPGASLPSRLDFADCLAYDQMTGEAIEATSGWLAEREETAGAQRGQGNPIASVMMPAYIRLVEEQRVSQGADEDGYREWRSRWFALDRYADLPGRREWLAAALAASRRPVR